MDMLDGMDPEVIKKYFEQYPMQQSPDGSLPNFQNPPSIAHHLRITVCVLLPLMLVFLLLRVYTALRVRSKFGADDYLSFLAGILVLGWCVVELLLSDGSTPLGIHAWNVPVSKGLGERYIRLTCASMAMYCISSFFIKTTLFVLYFRIFNPVKFAKMTVWISIAMMAVFYIASSIYSIVLMTPKSRDIIPWTKHLMNVGPQTRSLSFAMGLFGVVTDLITLILPVVLVLPLKLSRRKKIGVAAVFLVGLAACGCSLAGCITRGLQLDASDETYRGTLTQIFGVLELTVGHMCSCMPVIAVVFKQAVASSPFSSLINNLKSFTLKNSHSGGHLPLKEDPADRLPEVPRAHMTGLRTFIRKIDRSEGEATVVDTVPLETFNGLQSVDMDYHAQLRDEQSGRGWTQVSSDTNPHGSLNKSMDRPQVDPRMHV